MFGLLALTFLFVLKNRQKHNSSRTRTPTRKKSIIAFKSKIKAPISIPELQQAEEMHEYGGESGSGSGTAESLNGLQVIDHVSVDSDEEKNVPSLSYSHSITGFSDDYTSDNSCYCDNISDVSVEDEYYLTYEKAASKKMALNFRSIWNFGQPTATLHTSTTVVSPLSIKGTECFCEEENSIDTRIP